MFTICLENVVEYNDGGPSRYQTVVKFHVFSELKIVMSVKFVGLQVHITNHKSNPLLF